MSRDYLGKWGRIVKVSSKLTRDSHPEDIEEEDEEVRLPERGVNGAR